jgi:type II secretory ATPase GspE/PulE/Tfp pilus assembly ATPase PilB-like protein
MGQGTAAVSFRLDGVLVPITEFPTDLADRVIGRIKFLARLKTYQESLPQDGRIEKSALNARSDIRVATYPTVTGEKIVLRLFDNAAVKSLTELGFDLDVRQELDRFLKQTAGLMLLTGPAGSGKTTTIYACLAALVQGAGRHIITVEDPVEQVVPGTMQTEVNEARGLDFARAARHLLRQDPQVLVIGEIRDEETANIAVRASLTGHLVISTLHAPSCKIVLGPFVDALSRAFGRRLRVGTGPQSTPGSAHLHSMPRERVRGVPGDRYKGRVPVVESLRNDDALRTRISRRDLSEVAAKPSLAEHARDLVQAGVTSQSEVNRVLGF